MRTEVGSYLGSYRPGALIGSGGMGEVFEAHEEGTNGKVAIKVLSRNAATDRQLEARFLQEGRTLGRLDHPGIVKVLDCTKSKDGVAYMVMEYLHGTTLRQWLSSRRESVNASLACSIGLQIADALAYVHRAGIVHRDLKPENIMVLSAPEDAPQPPRIKLFDFGIAKVPSSQTVSVHTEVLTEEHKIMGTRQYMAPEQHDGSSEVTPKIDVYAFGVLLFEMLAGSLPFQGEEDIELFKMHRTDKPPALREGAPEAPASLGVLISSMLAKAPRERPTMRRCRTVLEEIGRSARNECPLPGLQPFLEAQAELFFGRRSEIDEIERQLVEARNGDRRWVQIEGQSGAGKSSLVQAGVRPRLEDQEGPDGPRWLIACLRPSQNPLRALAKALSEAFSTHGLNRTSQEILDALRNDPNALHEIAARTPPGCTLLLVIEQMEELFTHGIEELARFDERLGAELSHPQSPLRLLTTLRSDFLHRLEVMPRLNHLLGEASRHHLDAMDEGALRQVILGMAERVGMDLSESLADRIVRDTASTDCRLPLLGYALYALWPSREEPALRIEQRYKDIGGVGGALVGHANNLLASLSNEERDRARWIILKLIQVGRGVPDTRRSRTREEVLTAAGGGRAAEQVLEILSGARGDKSTTDVGNLRLLVLSAEQGKPLAEQHVDLIHETLLQRVPLIMRWINEARPLLECYADLEGAALVWEQTGYRDDALASGALLEHYRGGTKKKESQPEQLARMTSKLAQRFLNESERRERRRRWIKQAITAALVIAAVVTSLSAIYAIREKNHAKENLLKLIKNTDDVVSSTDWKFSRNPGNFPIRDELLTSLGESLASLSEQDRQTSEIIEIKTSHRQGDLELYDGTLNQAEGYYNKARIALSHIPTNEQSIDRWKELLALNHSKLGKVAMARGDLPKARDHFEKSLSISLSMLTTATSTDNSKRTLATSYKEMASLEAAEDHLEQAAQFNDKAVDWFSALSTLSTSETGDYDRSLLAEALCESASTANRRKNPGLAEELLSRAERTVPDLPVDTYSRLVKARIDFERGALAEAQKLREALLYYQHSAKLAEELRQGDPTRKNFRLQWIESWQRVDGVATILHDDKAVDEARKKLASAFKDPPLDAEDVRFKKLGAP